MLNHSSLDIHFERAIKGATLFRKCVEETKQELYEAKMAISRQCNIHKSDAKVKGMYAHMKDEEDLLRWQEKKLEKCESQRRMIEDRIRNVRVSGK